MLGGLEYPKHSIKKYLENNKTKLLNQQIDMTTNNTNKQANTLRDQNEERKIIKSPISS